MAVRIVCILMILSSIFHSISADVPMEMRALMNISVEPCNDFYHYACGKWESSIPMTSIDVRYDMAYKHNVETLLQAVKYEETDIGKFWTSCMDIKTINHQGLRVLQKDLKRIFDSLTKQHVLMLAAEFYRSGTQTFMHMYRNQLGTNYGLTIHPPSSSFEFLENSYHFNRYHEYVEKLMKITNLDTFQDVEMVVEIDKQLRQLDSPIEVVRTKQMSLSHGKKRWPNTLGIFINGLQLLNEEIQIDIQTSYFDKLEKWIQSTTLNELKIYVAYRMIDSRIHWVGDAYYNVWYQYFGENRHHETDRKTFCQNILLKDFSDWIGKQFTKKTYPSNVKTNVLNMFELIQDSMEKHFIQSTWLKRKEKDIGLKKLKAIDLQIGSTSTSTFPSILSPHDYYSNMEKLLSHRFHLKMKTLGQKAVDNIENNEFSLAPNARYISNKNQLTLPISILQPPFYNGLQTHPARNFGAIGFIIGHELTHAFDYESTQIESSKRLWKKSTLKDYKNRAMCFDNQYQKLYQHYHEMISFDGDKINLDRKQRENIADNAGVALAWDAYRKYMIRSREDMNNHGDQLFFLALGQSLCSKSSKTSLRTQLVEGIYSPSPERVNGLLMNNENFAKAFNCRSNTPMNPIEKCKIW